MIQRVVKTVQGGSEPDQPEVARILGSMGTLMIEAGEPDEGLILLERATDIRKKTFGYRSREVAQDLADLGLAYQNQDRPDKARRYYEESLQVLETIYGPEHPELEEVILEMIGLFEELGEKEQAEKMNLRIERIRTKKNS